MRFVSGNIYVASGGEYEALNPHTGGGIEHVLKAFDIYGDGLRSMVSAIGKKVQRGQVDNTKGTNLVHYRCHRCGIS